MVRDVPDHSCHDHGADVSRESQANTGEELADDGTDTHGNQDFTGSQHEVFRSHGQSGIFFHALGFFIGPFHIFLGAVEMEFFQQTVSHRAAHQGSGNQTEGSHGDGHGGGPFNPDAFQHGTESPGSPMAANQRNGAGAQAQQRMQAGNLGHAHTDDVLEGDQHGAHDGQDEYVTAAFFQQSIAGAEPYAGEEHVHEETLLHRVQFDGAGASFKQSQVQQGEQHAADNRVRDTIGLEKFDLLL